MVIFKAIKQKHYQQALELSEQEQLAYVLTLVEKWDFVNEAGQPIPVGQLDSLILSQQDEVMNEFEAYFNEKDNGQVQSY
jgi:hypothetical protein